MSASEEPPKMEDKPPEPKMKKKSKIATCCTYIYNSKTGEFLGRDCGSWTRIGIFYLFFYTFLFAFFFMFLFVMMFFLSNDIPLHGWKNGLITASPGLFVAPTPPESAFIAVDTRNYKFLVDDMVRFIELNDDKINTGPCTAASEFGYGVGEPCFAVRANKIIGWTSKSIFSDTIKDVTNLKTVLDQGKGRIGSLSADLRDQILQYATDKNLQNDELQKFLASVWIQCDGDEARDREQMGPISYYPSPAISNTYKYVKKGHPDKPPFVMIKFNHPLPHVPISINCKLISEGVEIDTKLGIGSIRFQFMVTSKIR